MGAKGAGGVGSRISLSHREDRRIACRVLALVSAIFSRRKTAGWEVAGEQRRRYFPAMSTVAEIEAAIEQLPTRQMLEVAGWLDERRGMIASSEALFQQLDEEEGEAAGKQWLGE